MADGGAMAGPIGARGEDSRGHRFAWEKAEEGQGDEACLPQ